jgi:cobalamin-dependent methionine synthase I
MHQPGVLFVHYRGKRYSFGYSACPELADQAKLFKLLDPESSIGVTLTQSRELSDYSRMMATMSRSQSSRIGEWQRR